MQTDVMYVHLSAKDAFLMLLQITVKKKTLMPYYTNNYSHTHFSYPVL